MSRSGRFTMLGSGGSMGTPVVGCHCAVCESENPRNTRTRPAGFLELEEKALLIDVGPDFRDQALAQRIDHIDGVLLTHTHSDHTAGLDDLRIFFFRHRQAMPCLLSQESLADLRTRFHYLFSERSHAANFTAQMDFQLLDQDVGEVDFLGIPLHYMSYYQGGMKVTGYRLGEFAYLTDLCDYTDDIFQHLEGVKKLVVSALRFTPSHVHLTIQQAVAFSQEVGAEQTWFTHMSHEVEHEDVNSRLPPHIRMGYDGLKVDFTY